MLPSSTLKFSKLVECGRLYRCCAVGNSAACLRPARGLALVFQMHFCAWRDRTMAGWIYTCPAAPLHSFFPTFYVFPGYGHVFVFLLLKTLPTRESNFQLCSSQLWSFFLQWLNMVSVLFSQITNLNWIMRSCFNISCAIYFVAVSVGQLIIRRKNVYGVNVNEV